MMQLFLLTNIERFKRGVPKLRWDGDLVHCAYYHSLDMAKNQKIFHKCNKGYEVSDRANHRGIP
ncbi:MAG: hypothetical protein KDE33_17150 [Bacteroidetes bacterium]|nr:hypothetical protein [Bacteroidota bacterium]